MSAIGSFATPLSALETVDEMVGFSGLFLEAVRNNMVYQAKRDGGGCELTSPVRPDYSIRTDSVPYEIALRLDGLMDSFGAAGSQKPDADMVQKIQLIVNHLGAAHELLKNGDNPHVAEGVSKNSLFVRSHAQYLARQCQ